MSDLERDVVKSILKIAKERGAKLVKLTPPGVESGTADLVGSYRGRSLHLEAKRDDTRQPSKLQILRLKQWKKAGAASGVVDSPAQFEALLDALDVDPFQVFNNEDDWRFTPMRSLLRQQPSSSSPESQQSLPWCQRTSDQPQRKPRRRGQQSSRS